MWGTLLNAITVLIGSALGLVIGGRRDRHRWSWDQPSNRRLSA